MRLFGRDHRPTRNEAAEEETRQERGKLATEIVDLDRRRVELRMLLETIDDTLDAVEQSNHDHPH